jgi:hypothetical protein
MTVQEIYFGKDENKWFDTSFSEERQKKVDCIREKISTFEKVRKFKIWGFDATNDARISLVYHTGTNGAEGSIKNSLLEVYNFLNDVEQMENVKRVDVADISIDRPDDVYAFAITIYID